MSPSKHEQDMVSVKFRHATDADAEPAAQIAAQVFEGVSFDYLVEQRYGLISGTTWQERKAEEVRQEILDEPQSAIVAEVEGQVVGFVTTRINERTRVGRILNLAVARSWQGKGIGRRLLTEAYKMLRTRGARYLQIETLETNAVGMHLYPKLGFREIVRKIYYFMEVDEWQGPE